jgi:small GTP-binding protein
MRTEESYEEMVKVILIGDSGVGKTSFLNRFCQGSFKHNIACTVGLDYGQRVIRLGERRVMTQLWDTAGHEKFNSITPSFYRSATAILLMFSVDNR